MKLHFSIVPVAILLVFLNILASGCKKKSESPQQSQNDVWDIDKNGVPNFVKTNYIELAKIDNISKYRSSVGHDYSDAFEHCRSMKHYFKPKTSVDWSTIAIRAPIKGKISRLDLEWAGTKIEIVSDDFPAFRFNIFHVNLSSSRKIGDQVQEGELLGTHIGSQTMSDIAVIVNDPTHQGRMVSYFETITDGLFNDYTNRGVKTRDDLMISKARRDANPITCSGDTFISTDTLVNWLPLN